MTINKKRKEKHHISYSAIDALHSAYVPLISIAYDRDYFQGNWKIFPTRPYFMR